MSWLIQNKIGLRKGEGLRASLMFTYIFLVIASLLIVKPVRNSLFLTRFGPEQLPYAFIIVALVSTVFALIYSRLAGRFALNRLIPFSIVSSAFCLTVVWFLLHSGYQPDWFIYAFYVGVAIFGVTMASQFWLLANYLFNAREARRIFGLLGAGGIAGGIFGGYMTRCLTPVLGTENLILLCVGFLCICLTLFRWVQKKYARGNIRRSDSRLHDTGKPVPFVQSLKSMLSSRHLTYMAGIIAVGVVVANLVDYQFNAVASEKIGDEDKLTAFFGFWYSNLSVFSLAIQLFITGKVLRKLGVGDSLYFLPAGIMVGALAILFAPFLWAAVLIKVGDGGFKQSINKAGLELLALPIPSGIKNRAKALIDIFVDNLATGIGGVLLVILTICLGMNVQGISLVIIGFIIVWVVLIRFVKIEYIDSFRQAIEKRTIDLQDPSVYLNDASVSPILDRVFEGDNLRQMMYIMTLMEDSSVDKFAPYLNRLIRHPSGEIRAMVLRLAMDNFKIDFSGEAKALITHEDVRMRIQAILYLCRRSEDPVATLESFVNDEDREISAAAMICAAEEYRRLPGDFKVEQFIRLHDVTFNPEKYAELSPSEAVSLKCRAAEVIGTARIPELYDHLHRLLEDNSTEVLREAVLNAGKTRSPEFIPALIEHLKTRRIRFIARKALAQFGEQVIDNLNERLSDPEESDEIRCGAAKVLAMIDSQKAVNLLMDNIERENLNLRYEVIKAMNKLRSRFPSLKFDAKRVEKLISLEVQNYYSLLSILFQHRKAQTRPDTIADSKSGLSWAGSARQLLEKAIQERLDINLERIFRLLGLKYSPHDIYNSYLGVLSRKPDRQANALEFLDNLLDYNFKMYIIPIVEYKSIEERIQSLPERYRSVIDTEAEYISSLLKGSDIWLKACVLFHIARSQESKWLEAASELALNPVPLVRESAQYAVNELEISK